MGIIHARPGCQTGCLGGGRGISRGMGRPCERERIHCSPLLWARRKGSGRASWGLDVPPHADRSRLLPVGALPASPSGVILPNGGRGTVTGRIPP